MHRMCGAGNCFERFYSPRAFWPAGSYFRRSRVASQVIAAAKTLVVQVRPFKSYCIMWEEFGKAFCLMLIMEGIMPFLYPDRWRKLVATLATISDRDLRVMGLVSMLIGLGVLLFLTN